MSSDAPKLTPEQLIIKMKRKNIRFDLISEEAVIEYLRRNNNYFRTASYRKNYVKYQDVKVVIIGQDPYHEPGQAMGMSFSVPDGVQIPPSLVNIFKEINADLGIKCQNSGNLSRWASQGILLLNAVLTVRKGQANSHKGLGWENLTKKIIELLNQRNDPVVFLLWGGNAKAFLPLIDQNKHFVLLSAHPSPLSAYNGFFGCKHFSKTNQILKDLNKTPIDWH